MGLLSALDFDATAGNETPNGGTEIEYRLFSWGEIYAPFSGDREHSLAARFILPDFPFKLFCSSIPYDDPPPQKLCLTFRAPYEDKVGTKTVHLSGLFANEIADEFAAFLSVVTRRRVFVGNQTRSNGLPVEMEHGPYAKAHLQEPQQLKEIDRNQIQKLLQNLRLMNRDVANSFIVAIRLYHAAIGMLYTEPEFSYLLLVTCLEAISSAVEKDCRPDDPEAFLDSRYPGWRDMRQTLLGVARNKLVELLLSNERFTFRKLEKFVEDNLPETFWSEVFDDAKPHRIVPVIGPRDDEFDKEHLLRLAGKLEEYEKMDKANLRKTLRNVYNARSSLVHEGKRFPASIVVGHFAGIPAEALDEIMTAVKNVATPPKPIDHLVLPAEDKWVMPPTRLDVPPLQTFERLVSRTLTNYLLKV